MENRNDKENYTRLCHLLIGQGTKALRRVFESQYKGCELEEFLNSKKDELSNISHMYNEQWYRLFPKRGKPDLQKFDISLLSILLQKICCLRSPKNGWFKKPKYYEDSPQANMVRLRILRNDIYAHTSSTDINDNDFESYWSKIFRVLTDLGVSKDDMKEIRESPLTDEAKRNVERLKAWEIQELKTHEKINELTKEVKRGFKKTNKTLKKMQRDDKDRFLVKLSKFNFEGEIENSENHFHPDTKKWLLKKVKTWFQNESAKKVLVVTAESGFGKTTLAAKIIQKYKSKLAACHFFKFKNSNYSNPMKMLESLASQICDSVKGFEKILIEQLKRPHTVQNLQDAFQVYLKEPLHNLPKTQPRKLIVIDGVDECKRKRKTDLLDVLAEEFPKLPAWLRVLVTSSPETDVKEKLSSLECIDI